jgi:hypothetical protein
MLVENVESVVYGEQQLIINFLIIFVILAPNVIVVQILIEVHNNNFKIFLHLINFLNCLCSRL